MQTLDHDSASIAIDASPEAVFALMTDIDRMSEFSPELVSCRWLDGAEGPAAGARFEAVNQLPGHKSWKNRPVVTVFEPSRRYAVSRTEPFAGTVVWSYELSTEGGKTVLTESYQVTKQVSRNRMADHRAWLRRHRPPRRPGARHGRNTRRHQALRRVGRVSSVAALGKRAGPKPAAARLRWPSPCMRVRSRIWKKLRTRLDEAFASADADMRGAALGI